MTGLDQGRGGEVLARERPAGHNGEVPNTGRAVRDQRRRHPQAAAAGDIELAGLERVGLPRRVIHPQHIQAAQHPGHPYPSLGRGMAALRPGHALGQLEMRGVAVPDRANVTQPYGPAFGGSAFGRMWPPWTSTEPRTTSPRKFSR